MLKLRYFSLLFVVTLAVAWACMAGVPRLINYQGTITGSGGPLDGTYDLTFYVYADSTGGSPLWTELHDNVPVTYGLFNVILGRYVSIPDPLFEIDERWIAVKVDADPEMEPRMRITAVPWTMRAALAESSLVSAPDGDWTFAGGDIYRPAGNVGIGVSMPAQMLDVAGTAQMTGFKMPTGAVNGYVLTADAVGAGSWQALPPPGSDSDWIITGPNMYSGVAGNVGVGTSSPTAKLTATTAGNNAVLGTHTPSGNYGYLGTTDYGAYGYHNSGNEGRLGEVNAGVWGRNNAGHFGYLGGPSLGAYGRHGTSQNYGQLGATLYGVYGYHQTSGCYGYIGGDTCGVYGYSNVAARAGVYGQGGGINGYGVRGQHNASGNFGLIGHSSAGVMGRCYDAGHSGVIGYYGSNIGSLGKGSSGVDGWSVAGYGVHGGSTSGYAGYFDGDVHITGTLSKAHGSFLIDHPLDPENKVLRHMFVESPENLCIYRGKIALDAAGEGTVELPSYFKALTKEEEATVTLTPIGRPFVAGYEWRPGFASFTVYGEPGREVSWVAYADRDDPVARMLTKPVEEDKGPDNKVCNRGELLNPEAYGYPESSGRDYRFGERRIR